MAPVLLNVTHSGTSVRTSLPRTSRGIGNSAPVALGYLIIAHVCCALSRQHYPEVVVSAEPAHAIGED
jgi:hypothetical protein